MPADHSLAAQATDALRRHVIEPLASRCVDSEYGGFLVDFDARWQPTGPHHKSLEFVTRLTTAFALLHAHFPDDGLDVLARRGCEYLQEVMWDSDNGGFFACVDRAGVPRAKGMKHPHANTYAVRCFLLNAPLIGDEQSASWIERSLEWLDEVSWDPVEGGYWGSFTIDNQRYEPGAVLPTDDGRDVFGLAPGFKEINTQGDAIDMQVSLIKAGSPFGSSDRLSWLAQLITERLFHETGTLPYLYLPDWRAAAELARVGYQFIMAGHLLSASDVIDNERLLPTACRLTQTGMLRGLHPQGGLVFAMPEDGRRWPHIGGPSDDRLWWTQLEAIHTLHLLSRRPDVDGAQRAQFISWRDMMWRFLVDQYFDEEFGGIREVPPPATPTWKRQAINRARRTDPLADQRKTYVWKDPLHEVTTLLSLSNLDLTAER